MEYYSAMKKIPSSTQMNPTDKMNKRNCTLNSIHYVSSSMRSSGENKLVHRSRSQGSSDLQGRAAVGAMETLVLVTLTGWRSHGSEQHVYTLISKLVKVTWSPRLGAAAPGGSRPRGSRDLAKLTPKSCPLQASPWSCWDSLSPSLAPSQGSPRRLPAGPPLLRGGGLALLSQSSSRSPGWGQHDPPGSACALPSEVSQPWAPASSSRTLVSAELTESCGAP